MGHFSIQTTYHLPPLTEGRSFFIKNPRSKSSHRELNSDSQEFTLLTFEKISSGKPADHLPNDIFSQKNYLYRERG